MTAQFIFALFQKNSDEHGVNQKGLFCHSGLNALNIIWRRFDIYRFVDHAVLEGIRVFEFTLKPIKYIGDKKERWYKFYFDPNEIDENQIQEIIDLNSSA